MTNTISDLQKILEDLATKENSLLAEMEALNREHQRISFAAEAEDNPAAKRRQADITEEGVTLASRLSAVRHAATEARSRLAIAHRDIAAGVDRDQAMQALKTIDALFAQMFAADKALADLVEAGEAMTETVTALSALGVTHPDHNRIMASGHFALATGIAKTKWGRYFPPLSHSEKTTFAQLATAWRANVVPHLMRRANVTEKDNADAAA